MSERSVSATDTGWPRWINSRLVERLVADGACAIRTVDGVRMVEPVKGAGPGPAYVEDPATGWWEYVYDVAVVQAVC